MRRATESFASCTGVKRGNNLSRTLFLFTMQAFMELIRNDEVTGEAWLDRLTFRTRRDGVMHGRERSTGGEP